MREREKLRTAHGNKGQADIRKVNTLRKTPIVVAVVFPQMELGCGDAARPKEQKNSGTDRATIEIGGVFLKQGHVWSKYGMEKNTNQE